MRRTIDRPLINYPMLLKTMGWLVMIESGFMVFLIIVALVCHDSDWLGFTISAAITFICGLLMTKRIRPAYSHMGRREGFLLTGSVWVVFSLFGMIPFLVNLPGVSVTDAFFESMAGFTTTGASVLTDTVSIDHGMHLWRALTQWIGGMGIILFTLAVLPMLNSSGGMQMFNAEVTGITHDKVRPRISQTAKMLWMTYISLTLIAFVCLWAGPMDWFDSLCHAFGTMSTGGYSSFNGGVSDHPSVYVYIVLTVFMYLGGVNFALIINSIYKGPRVVWRNEVLRIFTLSILATYVLFAINNAITQGIGDWQVLTIKPLFQIVSMFTSTGYTIAGFAEWGTFVLGLMFVMMFIGGCAGSTSGGAKIDRILFLWKFCGNEVRRCIHPNSITAVKLNGRVQPHSLVSKVIAFLCLYIIVIIAGSLVMMIFGEDIGHSFFSAFSCVSNTGISAGDAFYGSDFSSFCAPAKWVLSILMLIGRLELYTILILLTKAFWRR